MVTSGAVFPKLLTTVPNLIPSPLAFLPQPSTKPPLLAPDLEHETLYLSIIKHNPSAHCAGDQRGTWSPWKGQVRGAEVGRGHPGVQLCLGGLSRQRLLHTPCTTDTNERSHITDTEVSVNEQGH